MFLQQYSKIKSYFLASLISLLIVSCTSSDVKDWTILVYMAADNSLNGSAFKDIIEMQSAEFSDMINVIVQIDYSEFHSENYKGARRFEIFPQSSNLVSSLGEIDSGDFNSLSEYANWGFDRYRSEKKALIIWSHGNGWYDLYNRFCPDNESGNSIDIPDGDLRAAFQQINHHLDIVILDACNMLNMEVISEIYGSTDFIISSEHTIREDGFPYGDIPGDAILSIWEDHLSTENLSIALVNSFYDSYLPGGSQNYQGDILPISCSAVRSDKFQYLINDLQVFAEDWSSQASAQVFQDSRNECYEFNDLNSDIDLKQFFMKIKNESSEDSLLVEMCDMILADIDNCFIAQQYYDFPASDIGTASIWFPHNSDIFSDLSAEYEKLLFNSTGWKDFLENYHSRAN